MGKYPKNLIFFKLDNRLVHIKTTTQARCNQNQLDMNVKKRAYCTIGLFLVYAGKRSNSTW